MQAIEVDFQLYGEKGRVQISGPPIDLSKGLFFGG